MAADGRNSAVDGVEAQEGVSSVGKIGGDLYEVQAPQWRDLGLWPRPVSPGTKECHASGWNKPGTDVRPGWRRAGPGYGIGLLTGAPLPDGSRLGAFDVDHDDFVAVARAALGGLDCERFGSKGAVFFVRFKEDGDEEKFSVKGYKKPVAECLFKHRLCVIPPTIHPETGRAYEWRSAPLDQINMLKLPEYPAELVRTVLKSEHLPVLMGGQGTHDAALAFVAQLVAYADDERIMAIVRAALPEDYPGDTLRELPELIGSARNKGYDQRPETPRHSEDDLALRFAEQHECNLRYVGELSCWMHFDGERWTKDVKRHCFRFAREVCREAAKAAPKGQRSQLVTANKRAAVVSLAQDDQRLAATIDQWDNDPLRLNTPAGIVDLTTGQSYPHDARSYMTKICSVGPDTELAIPLWKAFLHRVTNGDQELKDYLQHLSGYCLTGLTSEQMLAFFHGHGGNGKGVFMNVLIGIMGDYHRKVAIEALLLSHHERHPTDIAGLKGARMVTADEVPQGRSWNETQIKTLTGGDMLTARGMRQDFFDFYPQFTLLVSGNHRPNLKSVDYAIRRRLQLVPFTVKIPAADVDTQLSDKLRAEWPGILAWAIQGCLDWQEGGLRPPQVVTDATDKYLEGQNLIGEFLTEYYESAPGTEVERSAAFGLWQEFCESRGERPGHARTFNDAVEKAGFEPVDYMGAGDGGKRKQFKVFKGLNRNQREPPQHQSSTLTRDY
jgi:putative DNA primase/helicase